MRPVLKLTLSIFMYPANIGGVFGVVHGIASSAEKVLNIGVYTLWTIPFSVISHGIIGVICGVFWPLTIYHREKVKKWI